MYATEQDIIDRYGEEALVLAADRDGDGQADAGVVDRALADATAEVDTYLAARYALPLASTPAVLTRLTVDIAVYRLSPAADAGTDERRQRYEDATALLSRIARGGVSLGLPVPPASSNGIATVTGPERRYGRGRGRVF
ncbi:gp436 family protein [Alkalilimnicola sp. S0819]|uniref:gp436 family protein n=1 Tax=Alkalilimnicola sp. S0819 TaxID=2613922 RepID=UPI0012623A84|nr:DUF1320 domain-containing protein [Alkalilimnicola sp. S0819]KAB7624325.1 DUF1320 domain-containing protein [Alkalilimnicola sp. S0819]MPQ16150.1 DUF1320 domain-containing protein [Alkalilimnicola sp. S0819]